MNLLAIIILFAIIFDFVLHGLADYLNLKMLRLNVPEAFEGVCDPERYRKSQQYLKANTRFGWVSSTLDVVVILAFWFGKGFLLLDQWVRSFDLGPIAGGLIYIGVLLTLNGLLSLPFRIYGTFVIEARFGFNKTTCPMPAGSVSRWKTFLSWTVRNAPASPMPFSRDSARTDALFYSTRSSGGIRRRNCSPCWPMRWGITKKSIYSGPRFSAFCMRA